MEMPEQGDIMLCTVDRIVGTTVFVKIDSLSSLKEIEGTIITSEIAPGRIRNLRDYVVPKKKIVCKVLRVSGNQINLSLRRVTQKEKKEVLEQAKLEKSYESILRSVIGEKFNETMDTINGISNIYDLFETSKKNPKELEKITGKENAKKILDIIGEEKEKRVFVKKELFITTTSPEGLEKIKNIFNKAESGDIEVKYLSAGKYSLRKESTDLKKANQELTLYIDTLEKSAKENQLNFAIKEK